MDPFERFIPAAVPAHNDGAVRCDVDLTETCPPDSVHIITHVETTAATVQDLEVTATIHQQLSKKGLLPKEHWVDCDYVDASLLLDNQQTYRINLIRPVQEDTS